MESSLGTSLTLRRTEGLRPGEAVQGLGLGVPLQLEARSYL